MWGQLCFLMKKKNNRSSCNWRFSDLSIFDVIVPSLSLQCVSASILDFSSALARSYVPALREGKWRAAHFQNFCSLPPSVSRAPAGAGGRFSVMMGESLGLGSPTLSKPVAFFSLESSPMIKPFASRYQIFRNFNPQNEQVICMPLNTVTGKLWRHKGSRRKRMECVMWSFRTITFIWY